MAKNQVKLNKCKEKWKDRDVLFSVNLVRVQSNLSGKKRSLKKKTEIFEENTDKEIKIFEENTNKEAEIFEENVNNEDEGEYINRKTQESKI